MDASFKLVKKLPNIIAHIFQTKIAEGDQLQRRHKNPKTYFCAKSAPTLSIKNYLFHLIKNLRTPPSTLILMMIYVERFLQSLTQALASTGSQYQYLLTSNNAHRIVMSALLLAHKYSIDATYPFGVLGKVVGVSAEELKILESEFLVFVKFDLYVSEDFYSKYEEVFTHWPDLGDDNAEEIRMEADQSSWKVERKLEDSKGIGNTTPVKNNAVPTDEDLAMTGNENTFLSPQFLDEWSMEEDEVNPPPRNRRGVADSPSSTVQNLDIRSHFYEDDPESEGEDTEMPQFDLSDLGEDEYFDDVFIQTY
ncbi:unnamed protein product [Moneuplotes crassus]|uniref:Cyclin-like domain-containing protein n=1 Tax=Euplotes crassus TaxID=5936 RepID=A0AAD1UNR9_EUPCR|nr:unnamed protein product [Moneuplotes crassus]